VPAVPARALDEQNLDAQLLAAALERCPDLGVEPRLRERLSPPGPWLFDEQPGRRLGRGREERLVEREREGGAGFQAASRG
jgi:hypothetical protein